MRTNHDMRSITECVICGRPLNRKRSHVDTCGERCYTRLLARQRAALPQCVLAMQCYCAGHARGNPANEPCDTTE
jgi:hypothetical protein